MLVDTHIHLYAKAFSSDYEVMLQEAVEKDIQAFFLPNIDEDSINPMLHLQKCFPAQCFPMMGLHPCSVKANYNEVLQNMEKLFAQHTFWGIGETGMDFYWDTTFAREQAESLAIQIQWAKTYNLPLILHCRNAFPALFDVLDREAGPDLRGIFHCFTGNADEARKALSYPGFLLGIGGVVTYKNSGLADVLQHVPIERIVLETDAPYLAPVPHRGKRNNPAFLSYTAHKLAEVYGISDTLLAETTTRNALHLFQLNT